VIQKRIALVFKLN